MFLKNFFKTIVYSKTNKTVTATTNSRGSINAPAINATAAHKSTPLIPE